MITLIGTSTTIIGFGLCGIDHIIEIKIDTPLEEVETIIERVTTPIIMIEERYVDALSTHHIIIPIPDRYADAPVDRLAALVRDVVGIDGDQPWE